MSLWSEKIKGKPAGDHLANISDNSDKGAAKLPSRNSSDDLSLIMGGLGAALWGRQNVEDPNAFKNLFSQPSYFDKMWAAIDPSKKNSITSYTLNIQTYTSNISSKINNIADSISSLTDNSKAIKDIIKDGSNNVLNLNINDNHTINDLNTLVEALNSVSVENPVLRFINSIKEIQNLSIIDTNIIHKNIQALNSLFIDNGNDSFSKLYENIGNLSQQTDIKQGINIINNVIDAIIRIISFDSKLINSNGIYKLMTLTGDTGPIKQIIDNINKFEGVSKDSSLSLGTLDDFFNSIIKLTEIGFLNRIRIKRNLKFIKNDLIDGIVDLIKYINAVTKELNDNSKFITNSIENINNILNLLTYLGEYKSNAIDEAIDNIQYIRDYLIDEIVNFIDDISTKLNINASVVSNTENVRFVIEHLSKIFEDLPSIKNMIIGYMKIESIRDLVKGELKEIIDQIASFPIIDDSHKQLLLVDFPDIVKTLNTINAYITVRDLNQILDNLVDLEQELDYIDSIFQKSNSITISHFADVKESFKDLFTGLAEIEIELDKMDFKKELKNYQALYNELYLLDQIVSIDEQLAKHIEKLDLSVLKDYLQNELKDIVTQLAEDGDIGSKLPKLAKINKPEIKKIENLVDAIRALSKLSNIIISTKLTEAGIKALSNTVDVMVCVVNEIKDIKNKDINKAKSFMQSFLTIVAGAGLVMVFGALIMSQVHFTDLLLFTTSLIFFVGSILLAFKIFNKTLSNELDGVKDAIYLVAGAGLIMLLGSIIVKLINPADLVLFTLTLSGFLLGVGLVFWIWQFSFAKSAFEGAENAIILIGGAGLIMILGSMIYRLVRLKDLLGFTISLGLFIFGIGLIFKVIGKEFRKIKNTAEEVLLLVAGCSLIMFLGAAIYHIVPIADLLGFIFHLSLFIFGVSLPFLIFNKEGKNVFKGATEFAILLVVASACLLLPKYLFDWNKDFWNVVIFVGILVAFVGAITWVYKKAAKELTQSFIGAIGLTILTTVSAFVILYAAKTLQDNPGLVDYAVGFGIGLIAYIFIMTQVAKAAGKSAKDIGIGLLAIGGILLVTYAAIKVVEKVATIGKMDGLWEGLLNGVGAMFSVILAIGLGAVGLSATLTTATMGIGAALLASGIGFILMISAAAIAAGWAINNIYNIVKGKEDIFELSRVAGEAMIDTLISIAHKMIDGFADFGIRKMAKLYVVTKVMTEIGEMLSLIAQGIKDWADLKIPNGYDKNGKPIGYMTLNDDTFTKAGENITKVVTFLGQAIVDVYDHAEDKSIFDGPILGFIGDSPFARVIKAMKLMGPTLSSVAKGIKEWADLKIVSKYDSKGNPIEYMSLGEGDFDNAAKNIKKVLTAIGQAIVDVVEGNEKIFGKSGDVIGDLLTESPAMVAAKAMKIMGEVLLMTAQAIGCYASGRFPIYDKDGKIVDYNTVTPLDIALASMNIELVLTALGRAIVNVVKNPANKDIFNDGVFTDSPAMVAANAMKNMADAINTMVDIIGKFKDLKLEEVKLDDVKNKIETIVSGTLDIMQIFMKPKGEPRKGMGGWFKTLFTGSQSVGDFINENIDDVNEANQNISKLVKSITNVIKSIASIGEIFNTNIANLALINDQTFIQTLENLFAGIGSINQILSRSIKLNIYDSTTKELKPYEERNKEIIKVIDSLRSVLESISKFGEDYRKNAELLQSLGKTEENSPLVSIKNTILGIKDIIEAISGTNTITSAISTFLQGGISNFDIISKGIVKLYETTSHIQQNQTFSKYVEDVEDFIESINGLDLNRLYKMNQLVQSMNELAKKLGSIDKLTDTLANKVTAVLLELVNQLRQAENVINNAHELQEKRKELIESSVKTIKSIMGNPMIVKVGKLQEGDNTLSVNGNNTISGDTYTSPSGMGGDETTLPSPEETPTKKDKEVKPTTKQPYNVQPLTEERFTQLMKQNLQNFWGK